MEEVQGSCDKRFDAVQDVLARQLSSGADLGASVAITIEGEMVVDVWGGWSDEQRTRPWAEDTITNLWSTTKTMTALSALVLVERGELNLDAPVGDYWPEFAANGKERIEVRHLLSHTSGVSGWEQPVTLEDIYDWDKSTAMLAAQSPWWEPGTASGYHMLNYGHLVGEVIRRITGRKLAQFFADEIAGPLGADFSIGVRPEDDERVSPIVPMPEVPFDFSGVDPNSPAIKTFTGPAMVLTAAMTDGWRRADIGAANGHGNARSVARIQAIVANRGTVDGVNLLSPPTIERIFDQQSDGIDLVLGIPLRFGIGYGLPEPTMFPYIPAGQICFWGGAGGSVIIVDLDRRMTIAYMMNKMAAVIVGNPSAEAIITAAYQSV